MAYEGQIAGVGDDVPGKAIKNAAIRRMQARLGGRARAPGARSSPRSPRSTELEFVNGGGTGSIELTTAEGAVTEIAAGSGFYAPVLFDHYRSFKLNPAAMFALPVVRKPRPRIATALGGGYLASGVGAKDRMPRPPPPGRAEARLATRAPARCRPRSGRGGRAALEIGDRVYFRHVKAGEMCERFNRLYLVTGTHDPRRGPDLPRRGQGLPLGDCARPGRGRGPCRRCGSAPPGSSRARTARELLPARVALGERRGGLEVALAPVRAGRRSPSMTASTARK